MGLIHLLKKMDIFKLAPIKKDTSQIKYSNVENEKKSKRRPGKSKPNENRGHKLPIRKNGIYSKEP